MKEIPFKTRNNQYSLPFTSFVPKSKQEALEIINQHTEYEELHIKIRIQSDEDLPPIAYLSPNGIVFVKRQHSYVFYKTIKDLENAVKLDKIMQAAIKELEKDPYFKNSYTKTIHAKDPKPRKFLLKDGTAISYMEYSAKSYKALFDNLQETSREKVKNGELIEDQTGHYIFYTERGRDEKTFCRCLLFYKKEDYENYIARTFHLDHIALLWQGRNTLGSKFLAHKESLLSDLANILKLDRDEIRFSKSAQNTIHRALWELVYTDEVANTLFLPLLMYLGELQIKTYGGEWCFKEIQKINAVIPYIWFQETEFNIARNVFYKIIDPDNKNLLPLAACLWNGKNENWMYKG